MGPHRIGPGVPGHEAPPESITMVEFIKEYWLWIAAPIVLVLAAVTVVIVMGGGDEEEAPFVYSVF